MAHLDTAETLTRPLVSVGVPTYNRLGMLRRAVESVLAQDYPNLELVISDNASTDGTAAWCEEVARRDTRVRFIRQPINRGPGPNFAAVFAAARGEFYLALGDDDWLDSMYISQCVDMLQNHPDYVVVSGRPMMFLGDEFQYEGRRAAFTQGQPAIRIGAYFWSVTENVGYHGVTRRRALDAIPPMPNVLGGDWIFVAWLAFVGKLGSVDAAINKSVAGTTGDWSVIVRTTGLPRFAARIPYLVIIGQVFRDIAWSSPVYRPAGRFGRFGIALTASLTLCAKFLLWSAGVLVKRLWRRVFPQQPFPLRLA